MSGSLKDTISSEARVATAATEAKGNHDILREGRSIYMTSLVSKRSAESRCCLDSPTNMASHMDCIPRGLNPDTLDSAHTTFWPALDGLDQGSAGCEVDVR